MGSAERQLCPLPSPSARPSIQHRPQDSGRMRRKAGQQGQDAADQPGTREPALRVHVTLPVTPSPLAPSPGIPVTARNAMCQGIFWFKRRKNIRTWD